MADKVEAKRTAGNAGPALVPRAGRTGAEIYRPRSARPAKIGIRGDLLIPVIVQGPRRGGRGGRGMNSLREARLQLRNADQQAGATRSTGPRLFGDRTQKKPV